MIVSTFTKSNYCFSQASSSSPTLPAPAPNQPFSTSPPDFLGWDATVNIPLQIRQDNITTPYSIEFWTNATKQMEIDGTTGDVGIGASPLSPFKQNVDNDINLNSSAWGHGYWIDTKLILSTPVIENSLVGENSGNTSGIEFSFLLSQTNYSTI